MAKPETKYSDAEKERLSQGRCPHCGTRLENGYGLAGGGMGVYTYCPAEACGQYFNKTQTD